MKDQIELPPGVYSYSPLPGVPPQRNPRLYVLLKRANGQRYKYKVAFYRVFRQGTAYAYKVSGDLYWCLAPAGYEPDIINGQYYVMQTEGSICPDYPVNSPPTLGEDYQMLVRVNLRTHALRTMRGGIKIPWLWIAILAGIVVVGFIAYQLINRPTGGPVMPSGTPAPSSSPIPTISGGASPREFSFGSSIH